MHELVIDENYRIRQRADQDAGCAKLKIFNFEGELFFGSGPEFEAHLERIEEELHDDVRILVLRLKQLRNPDAVCMHLLHLFIERVTARGVDICLSGVRDSFFTTLMKVGIVEQLGPERVFREVPQVWTSSANAIEWAHIQLGDDLCDACPRRYHVAGDAGQWHFVI